MASQITEISIALGDSAAQLLVKDGTVSCPAVKLSFGDYPVINRAFAPMVRTLCFDIGELALVSFLQALEAGKPIRLLPIVISGQMHHGSIFYDPSHGELRPENLAGRRVGMRAYSQTAGMWVRGILSEQYGVNLEEVTWVSWEGAHVAEYVPPTNVIIRPGMKEVEMVRTGDVSAILAMEENVKGAGLIPLIPDAREAAQRWHEKHNTVPINHMMVVTEKFMEKSPSAVRDVYDMLCKATDMTAHLRERKFSSIGYGADRIWNSGAIQLAMDYCLEQKLISRTFAREQIFADAVG